MTHIKSCMNLLVVNLLVVRAQTPNIATWDTSCLLYSFRKINEFLMFTIFFSQIEAIYAHVQPSRFRHKRYWARGINMIKSLLDDQGLRHLWLNPDFEMPRYKLSRNRIRGHFTPNCCAFNRKVNISKSYSLFLAQALL